MLSSKNHTVKKTINKNLEFQAGEGSCFMESVMFKWCITENLNFTVLKTAVLIYR